MALPEPLPLNFTLLGADLELPRPDWDAVFPRSTIDISPIAPPLLQVPSLVALCVGVIACLPLSPEIRLLPSPLKRKLRNALEGPNRPGLSDFSFPLLLEPEARKLDFSTYGFLQPHTLLQSITRSSSRITWLVLDQVRFEDNHFAVSHFQLNTLSLPELVQLSINRSSLPDELVSHIIRCSPQLQSLSAQFCRNTSFSRLLLSLIKYSPNLREINVSHNQSVPSHLLRSLAEKVSIERLSCNSSAAWMTPDDLHYLCQVSLESLRLLHVDFLPISDEDLRKSAALCTRLRSLSLAHCTNVTDEGVLTISRSCPALVEIVLDGCSKLTDAGAIALSLGTRTALKSLSLYGCDLITTAGHAAVAQNCPNLGQFDVESTIASLSALERLGQLKQIRLSGKQVLSTATVLELVTALPQVDSISICRNNLLESAAVQLLAKSWKLQSIEISSCGQLEDPALIALAKFSGSLEHIDIGKCFFTKPALLTFFKNAKKLKRLGLLRTYQLDDECLTAIGSNCPELNSLNLAGCPKISASAVGRLVKLLPQLQSLISSVCLDEDLLMSLAGCRMLHTLELEDCSDVTNQVLCQTVVSLSHLRRLGLSNSSLSDECLSQLLRKGNSLEHLSLSECPKLSLNVLPILLGSTCEFICIRSCDQFAPNLVPNYSSISNRLQIIAPVR